MREFEEILVERDVVGGLGELERLVGEARGRMMGSRERKDGKEVPLPYASFLFFFLFGSGEKLSADYGYRPHTLPPQQLYLAHLAPYLTSTQRTIEEQMQQLEEDNLRMVKEVEAQRAEVERLVGGLEGVIRDLEGANEVLGDVVADGSLRKEAGDVDVEMGGTGGVGRSML